MSVEVKNVIKKFGSFTALDNVSLKVESGELVALLGRPALARRPCCAPSPVWNFPTTPAPHRFYFTART
ncbi:MAG: hypothetical protein WDN00_11030 [Limisphaerales bacterium]